MDIVTNLKTEYNKVLKRWNNATEYLEKKGRTLEEVNKWLPEYESMLKQRNVMCLDIWKYSGVKPTVGEFENGFDVKEEAECQILHV